MPKPFPCARIGHRLGSDTAKVVVESWLDFTCPFSKKAYLAWVNEIFPHFEKKHAGSLAFVFQNQVQPWHPQSTYTHEASLVVKMVDEKKFWDFSTKLFESQENFYDAATIDKSRRQIYDDLAAIAEGVGVDKAKFHEAIAIGAGNGGNKVTQGIKYTTKLARQEGVHASPTFLINGVIYADASSSWGVEQWEDALSECF